MAGESQLPPKTVPDPSVFTTEAVERAIKAERDWTTSQFDVLRERLNGIDRATRLIDEDMHRVPTETQQAVGHLKEVMMVELSAVQTQFKERDLRQEREARDSKTAVDAAFSAAKEACLAADARILCADLVWRPAGDLMVGDELVAFDEETVAGSYSRRYRRATVTANAIERDALLLVNTEAGSVRCTYSHPWLVRRYRGHSWEWRCADTLRPGDIVMRMLDVWDVDRSYDAGWLAGILDGEGCLTFKSNRNGNGKIHIGQVAGGIADRIDESFKARCIPVVAQNRASVDGVTVTGRPYHAQAQKRWSITCLADVLLLLGSVRPSRLLVNSDQVWEGFSIKSPRNRRVVVTSVEGAGTGMVARLGTSTHTYIGDGFAMHNSAEQNKSNTLAINKSEDGTKEKIDKLGELFATSMAALSDKLDDVKVQVSGIEQRVSDRITAVEKAGSDRIAVLEQRVSNIAVAKSAGKEQLTSIYAFVAFLVTVLIIGTVLAANGVFGSK